ncbi:MAG: ribonuclease R [candidate division Zixibacteria bacterium]|nr:ribonuclease R [candidate division Zixibacteria bacterium]
MVKSKKKDDWILDYIRQNATRPMKIRELEKTIGIKEGEYIGFRNQIKHYLNKGKLVLLKRNRIGLPDEMDLVTGTVSVTRAGFGFCQCENRDDEIYISAHDLSTAFHGDRVMVRLKPGFGFKGKRTGLIIKILERKHTSIVGTFHSGHGYDYIVPDSKTLNRHIYITNKKESKAQYGEKVVVKLVRWDDPYLNPEGEIIERLGNPTDPGVDMLAIIREFGLPVEFEDEVINNACEVSTEWQAEMDNRPDLTKLVAFTIDPADAKDHDDAVSIEMKNGNYRLGVHIADVSHFVVPNSALDTEAFERGTSVYFPDRVIPMLPEELSTDVCSLRPNRKRLAFSIFMDFNKKGDVCDYELYPSVIKSHAKLDYNEVQDFFDGKANSVRVEKVTAELDMLRKLAQLLHKNRVKAGSLDFDLPEAKITLDKQGKVVEIGNRIRLESHRLVEEFMLAANRQVALHFLRYAQPTLYRVHDKPNMEKLEAFSSFISKLGHKFPVSPQMPTKNFGVLLKKVKGKAEEGLINELLVRSMAKAVYQPVNIGHFGLAFKHYLHFTSPIRRYPDLLVHRLLKLLKKGKYAPKVAKKLGNVLKNVGKQSSDRERRSMEAEREAIKAKQVSYMAGKIGTEYEGVISGVVNFGFFVRLIGPECEGLVRASTLDDDYYRYDEEQHRLVGTRTGKVFRLGDSVSVGVMKVDELAREIDLFIRRDESEGKTSKSKRQSRKRKK